MNVEQLLYDYPLVLERLAEVEREMQALAGQQVFLPSSMGKLGSLPGGGVSDPTFQCAIQGEALQRRFDMLTLEYRHLLRMRGVIKKALAVVTQAERDVVTICYFQRCRGRAALSASGLTRHKYRRVKGEAIRKMETEIQK